MMVKRMMRFNRLLVVGFLLVVIGAVLPFLIVIRVLPSTFLLNFLAYATSLIGIFLGILGMAIYVGEKRRNDEDDWYDR
jgi:hypothetical protein